MFKEGFSLLRKTVGVAVGCGLCMLSAEARSQASAPQNFNLVLVDKEKHQIHLAEYLEDRIALRKSYHVTLGKKTGDKEVESDLKTPEGIYFFTSKLTPPAIKKKLGRMALMMNYPNPIDQMAGKTGYAIMLHATDDPPRLVRDYDSEGCVVVSDDNIAEIAQQVRLAVSPIIIYPELKPEYLQVNSRPEVRESFMRWLNAWSSKDLDTYIGSYVNSFKYNGMNLKAYRDYKRNLNQKYSEINIEAKDLRFFYHPKYDVVSFTQVYSSKMKGGGAGFKSMGTKQVYFIREDGKLKIANESYTTIY